MSKIKEMISTKDYVKLWIVIIIDVALLIGGIVVHVVGGTLPIVIYWLIFTFVGLPTLDLWSDPINAVKEYHRKQEREEQRRIEKEKKEQLRKAKQQEEDAKRAKEEAALKKKETCPECHHYPMKKRTEILSNIPVVRNVNHIFEKEVPAPGFMTLKDREVVNVVIEQQQGAEIVSKIIYTCPKCGYKKEYAPQTYTEWEGPSEIRELIGHAPLFNY